MLDANGDGEVTLADFEKVAVQYLVGPGVLGPQSGPSPLSRPRLDPPVVSTKPTSSFSTTPSKPESQPFYQQQQPVHQPISSKSINPPSIKKLPAPLSPTPQRNYSEKTLHYLGVTKGIFGKHADARNTITAERVPELLAETYETLGRKGYRPNGEDVKVWMKLCDGNGDGHVEYEEYEYFVVRSMERSGFAVYQ